MITIDIKPLSINKAYYGKLTKTAAHRKYVRDVGYMLPKFKLPEPPYQLHLEFGFSSKASDIDNPTKMLMDIIAMKYDFNDKLIHRLVIEKQITPKGKEYFKFDIKTL